MGSWKENDRTHLIETQYQIDGQRHCFQKLPRCCLLSGALNPQKPLGDKARGGKRETASRYPCNLFLIGQENETQEDAEDKKKQKR